MFRHANPSNLRGSLFESNKDYIFYLPTRTQKQRATHFSIGASERTDEFFWWFWSLEDVESNCSWRVSHVSSQLQWFAVLVPCSAATRDCRLTHGINLDYRKTFWEINFLRVITCRSSSEKSNLTTCTETEKRFFWSWKEEHWSQKWRQTKTRCNCNANTGPQAVGHELCNLGVITEESRYDSREQISDVQFDNLTQTFLVWNIRFTIQVEICSDFLSDASLRNKILEMVVSFDEFKLSRSV